MKKDVDIITTVVGGIGAAAAAAQPVLNGVQPGSSMHPQDWMQLIFAIAMGVVSFFVGKQPKTNP